MSPHNVTHLSSPTNSIIRSPTDSSHYSCNHDNMNNSVTLNQINKSNASASGINLKTWMFPKSWNLSIFGNYISLLLLFCLLQALVWISVGSIMWNLWRTALLISIGLMSISTSFQVFKFYYYNNNRLQTQDLHTFCIYFQISLKACKRPTATIGSLIINRQLISAAV